MNPYDDYAVMVLCAGDADAIWRAMPDKTGNPSLPPAGTASMAYLTADRWRALGQMRCDDLFILKQQNCYYGLLLRCLVATGPMAAGDYLVVIRGTMTPQEWMNDAVAEIVMPAPGVAGSVGTGFWKVYDTMTYGDLAGATQTAGAAAQIAAVIRQAPAPVFLAGHSLGAALATYLARDLQAALGGIAFSPYFFASPKTGTQDYVDGYQRSTPIYTLVNFAADIVPWSPSSPPFVRLNAGGPTQDVHIIPVDDPNSPALQFNPGKNHNPAVYAHMLDPANPIAQRLLPP